jgi:hypothetical protein
MTRITGTVHESLDNFMTISCWILLSVRNISGKPCIENQSTSSIIKNVFPLSFRLWDNVEKPGRTRQAMDGTLTGRMRFACWIYDAVVCTHYITYFLFYVKDSVMWKRKFKELGRIMSNWAINWETAIGSENEVWPPDDGRKDTRNMLRNNWLPRKSLIVASSWSHLYFPFIDFLTAHSEITKSGNLLQNYFNYSLYCKPPFYKSLNIYIFRFKESSKYEVNHSLISLASIL